MQTSTNLAFYSKSNKLRTIFIYDQNTKQMYFNRARADINEKKSHRLITLIEESFENHKRIELQYNNTTIC